MFYTFLLGSSTASVLALLLITVDRYITILHALHYDIIVTPVTMTTCIATGWICAVMVTVLPLTGIGIKQSSQLCQLDGLLTQSYLLSLLFLTFVIPVIIMLLLYTRLAIIANKHRRQIKSLNVMLGTTKSKNAITESKAITAANLESVPGTREGILYNRHFSPEKESNRKESAIDMELINQIDDETDTKKKQIGESICIRKSSIQYQRQLQNLETQTISGRIEHDTNHTKTSEHQHLIKDQWKAAKTIFIILGYYIFSWVCFYINMLLLASGNTGPLQ